MSGFRRGSILPRTEWTIAELERDRLIAIGLFRRERLEEPLEQYAAEFEQAQAHMEDLLEGTVDLSQLSTQALEVLTDQSLLESFRYLAGPPISESDLKLLVDSNSLAKRTLLRDPGLVARLIATILDGLDRRRFPWVTEQRVPTEAERDAAVLATAALIATQRVETWRRNQVKQLQEEQVRDKLIAAGLTEIPVPRGGIPNLLDAPAPGQFCGETDLAGRRADLIIGLWDKRCMPIECKVSNSSVNSIKRLNNDTAAKAANWLTA